VTARVAIASALAALVAWSFATRWAILTASPFPVGVDGYFYPVQLRSLLASGHLAYPASPLAFWLMLPFAAVTDPITGAKLGAALYGALIALPAYGVGARLARSRGAGVLAAVVATTSAGSLYTSVEFVKNGVGLTVALTALWLVLRACETASRPRVTAAGVAILAALLTHKMAAGLVIVLALPAAIVEAVARGALRGRRLLLLLVALAVAGALLLVLGLIFPERLLSPADLALAGDLFSPDARWSAPALASPRVTLAMAHEALLAGVAAIVALPLVRPRREPGQAAMALIARGICVLGLVIALPWLDVADPQRLGFRLRVVAFVPLALCAAIVLARAAALLPRHRDLALALVAALLLDRGVRAIRLSDRVAGEIVTHPALVTGLDALSRHVPAGSTVVIPERHIAFMAAWYLRAHTSLTPTGRDPLILPLAWIGAGSALDDALFAARAQPEPPIGGHPRHPNGLVLVPAATWRWIVARVPELALAWPTR
jgi:hypothetical protein